jgi:hypothetical protein
LAEAVIESGGELTHARFLDSYLGRGRAFVPFDDRHSTGSQLVASRMS